MQQIEKRGGHRAGSGRKPKAGATLDEMISLRVTASQLQHFKDIGGSEWLRRRLDESKNIFEQIGDLPTSMGIYAVLNMNNNMAYIGQTNNVRRRSQAHLYALESGKHRNKKLQQDWLKYGKDSFRFCFVCSCLDDDLHAIEEFCISAQGDNKYNIFKNSSGRARDVSGRKPIYGKKLNRIFVYVDEEQEKLILEFGNGNFSEGCRNLVNFIKDKIPKI